MKYIIIDDNEKFAATLCNKLIDAEHKMPTNNLAQFAETLKNTSANDDVICINVSLKTKDSRQGQTGIELLIWLRIKDVMNHVVLYSFETLHSLLNRNPKHLIAASKGTSFLQLPFAKNELVVQEQSNETEIEESVRQTLKVHFDNKGTQHRLANIYGLWFMFNVHNNFFQNEELQVNIFGKEFIQQFDALQLQIANCLTSNNNNNNSTRIIVSQITNLKNAIRTKNPKILYIDDKADIGWAEFLKKAIYGNEDTSNFQSIAPEKVIFADNISFETFCEEVKSKIWNNSFDCILLDLRLADETGDIDDLDNLTGIQLLKKIHKSFPALSVVMFTASNKAKSVKKIIACGAESLWTKPGLDELKDNEFYLESYRELLSYLNDALNKYSLFIEKQIVTAQFQVESLPKSNYPNQLKDVNVILTDTTFWCNTRADLVKNHKSARKLLNLSNGVYRKKFIVIDDVTNELFIHTQKSDLALKKSAQYGLEAIQGYKDENWIRNGFQDVENAIKENISYLKESVKGGGFHIVSNVKKVHSYHADENEATAELTERKNAGYKPLHADDTFQMLIPYFMVTHIIKIKDEDGNLTDKTIDAQNVLFVTDDFNSNVPNIIKTIGFKFGINNLSIPQGFLKEENLLKITANGHYCLIAHSKVLHKICFPNNTSVAVVDIPNTP